jgi:hypothetical protein
MILTLLGLSLLLGYIGFDKHLRAQGGPSSTLDILYRTIQLATLESGSIFGPISWELEIARWMVPFLTAYTAVLAVATLFRRQVQMMKLYFLRDHVVICGLGEMGSLLARGFRQRGYEVVAIESDEDNPHVEVCREHGGIVLIGNVVEPTLLQKAGVHRARHIVSVCGDDGVNAEVAVVARSLVERRSRGALTCSIHLVNPQLYELLREQVLEQGPSPSFRLELFNVFERGASILLSEHPAFDPNILENDLRPPHILIIGLGQLGEGLLTHAARAWHERKKGSNQKLTISVVDRRAVDKIRSLESRFSQLSNVCELTPFQIEVRGHEFEEADFLSNARGEKYLDKVYICLDDHSLGLQTALRVRHRLGQEQPPIIVRMAETSGLAKLIHGGDRTGKSFHNIHTFDLLRQTCTPDLVLAGIHELLAQTIHREYLREMQPKADEVGAGRALVPWEELPEDLKESNRQQVDHISAYLLTAGYGIKPLSDWDAAAFQFMSEEVELMARLEHNRWMEERINLGWRYGPGQKNPKDKTNPSLVEWESLPSSVKGENLRRINKLPAVLAEGGFQVYRISSEKFS